MNLNGQDIKKSVEFAVSCPVSSDHQAVPVWSLYGQTLVPFGSLTGLQTGEFRSGTWGDWRSVSTEV